MKKYTANYTYTNPNFVIQNLEDREHDTELYPLLCVIKNILQRGFPTVMSKYLQDQLGSIHEYQDFNQRLLLAPAKPLEWLSVIRGSEDGTYNPARDFIERILPNELSEYSFIRSMFIPEMSINDIVGYDNPEFADQRVDFYLPQAQLVVEIDGSQHNHPIQRAVDAKRDSYFVRYGIQTVRIKTDELEYNRYQSKIATIQRRVERFARTFDIYKSAYQKAIDNQFSNDEINHKLIPTAVIRFQLLIIELLINQYIDFENNWYWRFNIKCDEPLGDFARLAINDIYTWLNQLALLRDKQQLPEPEVFIQISGSDTFEYDPAAINVDFSLFKNYTDENTIARDIIFVRSDYFTFNDKRNQIGLDKNYFKVSTTNSINYRITDRDKAALRFFLQNIFNKKDFRDGQFSIIANALNMNDTIGLLPTGGGKSLCYQLPCLLQPSINFVVCPIKSLMYDQVDNLRRTDVAITNVNMICGDMSADEKKVVMHNYSEGKYLLVWISPERFQIKDFRASLSAIIANFNLAYAVIDEVHCMSEWGHDFRTSYLNLTKTIDALSPQDEHGEGRIKFVGLTATASVNVLKDIKIEFSRRKQTIEEENIKTLLDYTRPELEFSVIHKQDKFASLLEIFEQENIPNDDSKATLIFSPYVNGENGCYNVANQLFSHFPNKVAWYSGSCPKSKLPDGKRVPIMPASAFDSYKAKTQCDFKDNVYQILCATKAFGMGIDKQNIFYTFHYGLPASVEALYQEAGRAGRWDKSLPENANKKGKCFVIHSPELEHNQENVEKLFSPNTSISIMNEIFEEVTDGKDIFTQMYLFLGQLNDIEREYKNIMVVIDHFYKENECCDITYDDFKNVGDSFIGESEFEKIIYRLCLLGIVEDWTRDFINSFSVKFKYIDEQHILSSLESYIKKYDPNEDIAGKINSVTHPKCDTFLKKSVWYLLEWIFQHITENRKQSLKTLSDWCVSFTDGDSFKRRIDAYFTFNESTYVLQHIAEHPLEFSRWFEVFYVNDKFITIEEFSKLRDRLSRFLEGYHNNPGLNFVSGIVRFMLDDFEDADGEARLKQALQFIHDNICGIHLNSIRLRKFNRRLMNLLGNIKTHVPIERFTELCVFIGEIMPNLIEEFIETFDMIWLHNESIVENIEKLKKINIELYEQIGRIQ